MAENAVFITYGETIGEFGYYGVVIGKHLNKCEIKKVLKQAKDEYDRKHKKYVDSGYDKKKIPVTRKILKTTLNKSGYTYYEALPLRNDCLINFF
jgi:hypothetical protein